MSGVNEIVEMQHNSGMKLELPSVRFFVPTQEFWPAIINEQVSYSLIGFIDCGTGSGDVPAEARARSIRMAGCDLYPRADTVMGLVQIIPAHKMPFSEGIACLICRPDHGGWVDGLIPVAMEKGARVYYVGLEHNLERDINSDLYQATVLAADVGEEGEALYSITLL